MQKFNIKNIFKKIDKFICRYMGIEKQEVTPITVKKYKNKLVITNTESFKRHSHNITLCEFFSNYFKDLEQKNKDKLGIAIGKSIAKNFIISFDEINIIKNSKN